jgi:hypothetical protein
MWVAQSNIKTGSKSTLQRCKICSTFLILKKQLLPYCRCILSILEYSEYSQSSLYVHYKKNLKIWNVLEPNDKNFKTYWNLTREFKCHQVSAAIFSHWGLSINNVARLFWSCVPIPLKLPNVVLYGHFIPLPDDARAQRSDLFPLRRISQSDEMTGQGSAVWSVRWQERF